MGQIWTRTQPKPDPFRRVSADLNMTQTRVDSYICCLNFAELSLCRMFVWICHILIYIVGYLKQWLYM